MIATIINVVLPWELTIWLNFVISNATSMTSDDTMKEYLFKYLNLHIQITYRLLFSTIHCFIVWHEWAINLGSVVPLSKRWRRVYIYDFLLLFSVIWSRKVTAIDWNRSDRINPFPCTTYPLECIMYILFGWKWRSGKSIIGSPASRNNYLQTERSREKLNKYHFPQKEKENEPHWDVMSRKIFTSNTTIRERRNRLRYFND